MLLPSNRADLLRTSRKIVRPRREKRFADEARFIRSWLENPGKTGAVSPSSPYLARAMAAHVDPSASGQIVELGPGTGPVTQALLRRGVAPERLVLVEFDAGFCRLLERRFPGVRVIHGDAFALSKTLARALDGPAAAIVSGLPLLNTPEPRRLALLAEAFGVMSPEGVFIQFTYGVMSPIPKRSRRERTVSFEARCSAPIWLNLPPARIWTYRRLEARVEAQPTPAEILLRKIRQRTDRMRRELKEQTIRMKADFRGRSERSPLAIERNPNAGRGADRIDVSFFEWPGGPGK